MDRKFKNLADRRSVPVGTYEPSSHEEYIVWEIARYVGDKDMRPLLSILRQHGLPLLENAYREYRNLEDVVDMRDKPAFLMHLVKKHIARRNH